MADVKQKINLIILLKQDKLGLVVELKSDESSNSLLAIRIKGVFDSRPNPNSLLETLGP